MRDIDLFISVATTANDPQWREVRLLSAPARTLWDSQANAELAASGEVRKAVLERVLPALKIGPQCTLEDRSLLVKGKRNSYVINLGTANVMTHPGRQFVCIVQGGASPARDVFLPFDGDALLSLVLSKANLLANDHKIADESILRQIGA